MRRFIFNFNEWLNKGFTWKLLDELLENDSLSRHQIEEIQWQKLEQLISFVYDNVPYYRRIWKKVSTKISRRP